jgi:hypothetical protein
MNLRAIIDGWQIHTAPWVIAVACAFVIASAWFFVRSLRREGRGGWMTVLHALRLLIALLIAGTLLRPERVVATSRSEKPGVVVLWMLREHGNEGCADWRTRDGAARRLVETAARGKILGAARKALRRLDRSLRATARRREGGRGNATRDRPR